MVQMHACKRLRGSNPSKSLETATRPQKRCKLECTLQEPVENTKVQEILFPKVISPKSPKTPCKHQNKTISVISPDPKKAHQSIAKEDRNYYVAAMYTLMSGLQFTQETTHICIHLFDRFLKVQPIARPWLEAISIA